MKESLATVEMETNGSRRGSPIRDLALPKSRGRTDWKSPMESHGPGLRKGGLSWGTMAEQGNRLPRQSQTPGSSSFLVPPQASSWRQQQSTITCGSPCRGHGGASSDTVPVFTGCIVSSEAQQTAAHPPPVLVNSVLGTRPCAFISAGGRRQNLRQRPHGAQGLGRARSGTFPNPAPV